MADVTGEKVLTFLARQRLPANPRNFTLGYHAVTGDNAIVAKAVGAITDNGVRITQEEVDEIMASVGIAGATTAATTVGQTDERSKMLHQMLRLDDIAATTANDTGRFGRDLAGELGGMGEGAENAIVVRMIERAKAAEGQLAQTRAEMNTLRQDLEAAKSDATIDALTGLVNRRSIDGTLAALAMKGKRRTIALCDIDRFKVVNDTFGHAVGDRVLKTVAGAIARTCEGHVVGRFGGEEFIIIMEDMSEAAAAALVDAARKAVTTSEYKLRENDKPLGMVSFSAGVSMLTDNDEAMRQADERLYAAKSAGRNQVVWDAIAPLAKAA